MAKVPLPRYDKRTAVLGSSGSGKTQFAVWLLSERWNPRRVCIIFDFKGDELIEAIGPTEISIFGAPPKKPGLYVVRPIPELHDEAVDVFLWKCWAQENMLLYFDEGFMIPARSHSLKALLTQGRSKRIEMIILSQRPVWMSRFVFSEANYFCVMNLTDLDDRKTVKRFVGGEINLLPKYHSLWYDVDGQRGFQLAPVPSREVLLAKFEAMLARRVRVI